MPDAPERPRAVASRAHHVAEVLRKGGHRIAAQRHMDLAPLREKIERSALRPTYGAAGPSDGDD